MNPLFHRAYDKYLIGITPDYIIEVSEQMMESVKEEMFRSYLKELHHSGIYIPEKFSPDKDLLAIHYECYKKEH